MNELKGIIAGVDAEIIIFNNELSPSQLRNLEKTLEIDILDRTSLILKIFASRAKTREAKLQVEVSRLKYMLPRLVGANKNLNRQAGSVGSGNSGDGTRNRGEGETKLELDRRQIEQRIIELNKQLQLIEGERKTQRKKRNKEGLPTVALVGYTNTGKSTIMNTMVELYNKGEEKKVLEKDMLFATLETSVRSIRLPDNKSFLLSDTVGFVRDLPHDLVKAFRSTLEEACQADLLIHVVDYSNPNYKQQIEVTLETLRQIGAGNISMIFAYNKIDLVGSNIPDSNENEVYISARTNIGLDKLIGAVSKRIFTQYIKCQMLIPYDKGSILSYLNENANIYSTDYQDKGTFINLECKQSDYVRYKQFVS